MLIQFIPEDFPRKNDFTVDEWVFGFAFALAVLTGVIFGLIPALIQSKPNINKFLKDTTGFARTGIRANSLRSLLVVLEVGLTLMLVISASLILRSVFHLQMLNLGFDLNNKLTMKISLPREKYPKASQHAAFFTQAIEEIESLPGVQSAATVMPLPLDGNTFTYPFAKAGDEGIPVADLPKASHSRVSSTYFQTMDIHLLSGRLFTDQDGPQAAGVAIINENMARRFWRDSDPVGSHLTLNKKELTIVGVVQDVQQSKLDTDVTPQIYQPYLQTPPPSMYLVVSPSSDLANLVPSIQERILALDDEQPIQDIATMESRRDKWLGERRLVLVLLMSFAVMALSIAAFGIYGVIAHNVAQRTQEIGIRLALGAKPSDILKLVVGQGLAVTLIGVAVGLAGAFAFTRALSSWVFGVSATDPLTVVAASVLLGVVATLACYLPARRAIKIDPVATVRYE